MYRLKKKMVILSMILCFCFPTFSSFASSISNISDNVLTNENSTESNNIIENNKEQNISELNEKNNVIEDSQKKIQARANNPTITLTANPNPSKNAVDISWKTDADINTTFKVYQKKPGSTQYQSISFLDYSATTTQCKVLNIYPVDDTMPDISFKTADGKSWTLKKSANIKQWMESPQPGYPKGYGLGLMEIIPVSTAEFNANPQKYLLDEKGQYKVDVIYQRTMGFKC